MLYFLRALSTTCYVEFLNPRLTWELFLPFSNYSIQVWQIIQRLF